MARILLLPAAIDGVLAHVGSCATVGHELAARGQDVVLAYPGSQPELFENGLELVPAAGLESARLRSPGLPVFRDTAELLRLVQADLELLERIGPDAAFVEYRVSGHLACELAGVPRVGAFHTLAWSEWSTPGSLGAQLSRPNRLRRAARPLRRRLRRGETFSQAIERRLAEARLALGLPPATVHGMLGDLVACTTTPLLTPTHDLPQHWRYVGPLTWSAPVPDEPLRRCEGGRPLVYVTQGSTGRAATLRRVVAELGREDLDVLVTTGDLCDPAELEALGPNVVASRLLPGRACMEAADLAVIHGGDLTASEAHLAGVPVVVVPHAFDQLAWADRVGRLRTGIAVLPPSLPGGVRRAVRRILRQPGYRRAAERVAIDLKRWDGPGNTASLVEALLRAPARR